MEQPIPPLFDIPELEYVGDFYVCHSKTLFALTIPITRFHMVAVDELSVLTIDITDEV